MFLGQTAGMNFPLNRLNSRAFPYIVGFPSVFMFPAEMPPPFALRIAGAATQYRSLRSKLIPCCGVIAARHFGVTSKSDVGTGVEIQFGEEKQKLVGGLEHVLFSHLLGIIIPTD